MNSATLINNAAVMPQIAPLRACDLDELTNALRVGLEAALILTSSFLANTRQWSVTRRILNISSGLGRHAMASQSAYCASKAGLDHFTRCLALDEALAVNGARVCSLAPGVIDTDMQAQLRTAPPEHFPDQTRFSRLKQSNQLASASDTADRVLSYLARSDFGNEPVADIRDWQPVAPD
ncbi:benzil reductase ((S)-benzoin forming) [mine drainage metagenome]|uniref:Benzil reductase ((S)-benzoin forming) n=1 Tax=mine drainage metagenome TaxID=410659 RepID=A0A1J5PUC8_9ZZZZ